MKILIVGGLGHGQHYEQPNNFGEPPRKIVITREPRPVFQPWAKSANMSVRALLEEHEYELTLNLDQPETKYLYFWTGLSPEINKSQAEQDANETAAEIQGG